MKFRFIGQYTNGHSSINASGYTFEGHEPAEVSNKEAIRRLSGNPEFEQVADKPAKAENPPAESENAVKAPASAPKPKKPRKPRKKA